MNAQTERLSLAGVAGAIEVLRDRGAESVPDAGVAVIAHPHPLFGGTMDNKVVQTLARAFVACGYTAIRFNFRGVGGSAGVHDEGRGETDDFLQVVRELAPQGRLAIAGFSFGAFVASQATARLDGERDIRRLVLVGTAASRFEVATLPAALHEHTLVVHGEQDDTVPLAAVMDWARPQALPITVVPGGGHFFHGQLPLLKSLVVRHLSSAD
ncbi:alpha/beta hydrolase [Pseudacidovorax intermedius]|uniref:alpha/beta hydrolase n=1 Tax=Pseudacidovorax intermedius TaxID=433924 RepID=UPI0026F27ACE|nr:alpha/beta fold hydrolase [Pseudacidovorax intermedius]